MTRKIVLENAKRRRERIFTAQKNPNSVYSIAQDRKEMVVWPTFAFWQEPVVKVGDVVEKTTACTGRYPHFLSGKRMDFYTIGIRYWRNDRIGKAAVYKHIPDYFPKDVGVVGGIVGVLGGLWLCRPHFGFRLPATTYRYLDDLLAALPV
ncbi:MAG: hypothetical protein R2857_03000 [Vampirovibrionales bacterium]